MPKAVINNIVFNEIRLKPADILIMKFGKGGFNRQTARFHNFQFQNLSHLIS